MFGKKLVFLIGGYIAGNVVASLYSEKKGKEVKGDLKKAQKEGKDEISVLFENVFITQRHFFSELSRYFTSDRNKKLFSEKIQDIKQYNDDFKNQARALINEFQKTGSIDTSELQQKLESLLKSSKNKIIEHFSAISPEKIAELKSQLQESFQDIKKTLKK